MDTEHVFKPGESATFAYSLDPNDPTSEIAAELGHRTGQTVAVLALNDPDHNIRDFPTFTERADAGALVTYGVVFPDGHAATAFEDELTPTGPSAHPLPDGRWCAYAQDGIMAADGRNHMVAYIVEDESGYYSTTYTGDLDYCRKVAASVNEALNVSEERASQIVMSSFAAHNREQAGR